MKISQKNSNQKKELQDKKNIKKEHQDKKKHLKIKLMKFLNKKNIRREKKIVLFPYQSVNWLIYLEKRVDCYV